MFTPLFVFFKIGLELLDLLALLDTLLLKRLALQLVTATLRVSWPLRIELFVLAHSRYGAWRHLKRLCFLLLPIAKFLLCAEVIISECELDSNFALTWFANASLPAFVRKWVRLHCLHGFYRIIFLHILKSNGLNALLLQLLVIY